jgi:ClpX C4-type zinc finger
MLDKKPEYVTSYRCFFCDKPREQAARLTFGVGGIAICNECSDLCTKALAEGQDMDAHLCFTAPPAENGVGALTTIALAAVQNWRRRLLPCQRQRDFSSALAGHIVALLTAIAFSVARNWSTKRRFINPFIPLPLAYIAPFHRAYIVGSVCGVRDCIARRR